jgi:hypothetical protein
MSVTQPRAPLAGDEPQTNQLILAAGTAFGLAYALTFSLLTWGYDSFALTSLSATLAWGKLVLGLPPAVIVCVLVGRRGISTSAWARFLGLWPLVSGLLGAYAAHLMLSTSHVLVWVVDRRFAQLPVFPYGRPDAIRTGFVVVIEVVLGASVGLVQNLAVDWAWDRATPSGHMGWRSWMVMLLCIPLAIFPAITIDQLVHRPLRTPQQAVGEYLDLAMTATPDEMEQAGRSENVVRDLQGEFSEDYDTYLVEFDPDSEAWYAASVDAVFDNGFRMRCLTFGANVVHCEDLSEKLDLWMGGLISTGLHAGQLPPEFDSGQIAVGAGVVDWLSSHRRRLEGVYSTSVTGQHGGWILMEARFDSGFRMGCYFRSARPAVVDRCVELPATSGG